MPDATAPGIIGQIPAPTRSKKSMPGSLSISAVVNYYNRKMMLVER